MEGQVQWCHSILLVLKFHVLILIYFRAPFMEIFSNIFIWFLFCNFLIFLLFVKFVCSEMLASRFWKSLLFLTHSSWAFSGLFFMCLAVIWISFWLIFITGVCSKIPCSIVSCLKTPVLWIYYKSTDWLPHDVGYECQESRNRIVTVLYPFFFCLLFFTFI